MMERVEIDKEKAKQILFNGLSYVYCDNCRHNMKEGECDDCHRKYMNWGISEEACENLINKIIEK